MNEPETTELEYSENELKKHEYIFKARMNSLYHERLDRFYNHWINWTSFASLLFASTAFVAVGQLPMLQPYSDWIVVLSALVVAILNSIVLAFSMNNKSKEHSEFKRRWSEFHGEALAANVDRDGDFSKLDKIFVEINASETPPNQTRLKNAHKATVIAMGLDQVPA